MSEFPVNQPNALRDGNPSTARLLDGSTVIAFASEVDGGGALEPTFRLFDDNGDPISGQIGLGQQAALTRSDPEVAALDDGSFVIAWISGSAVLAQRFSADGGSLGPIITVVSRANLKDVDVVARSDAGFVISALFGVAQGGGFAAVTYDFGTNDATTSVRTVVQSGQYGGSGLSISTVETPDGGLFTLWAGNSGIQGAFENTSSITIDSDSSVFDETEAQAAVLGNGQVVAAWAENGDIHIALLDPEDAGTRQSGTIANSNRVEIASQPAILALANGGFVVTWTARAPNDSSTDLRGQVFDASGSAVGGGFTVNEITMGDQSRTAVSALPDGGIRVVWQSDAEGDLEVTARDFTQAEITAGTYQVVEDSPTQADVMVTGTLEQGALLGAGSPPQDADGIQSVTYQWFRGPNARTGVEIVGAVDATYAPRQADVGEKVGVTVAVTDGYGITTTFEALSETAIANVNDPVQGEVTLVGAADGVPVGATLQANPDLRDPDGLGLLTYAWLRDGQVIVGANSSGYAVSEDDLGARISARVSYVDGYGTSEVIFSDATTRVGVAAPTEGPDIVTGGPGDDTLTGLGGDDTIYGEAGADTIDGGTGSDRMIGGQGSDTYFVDDSGDSVLESRHWSGVDLVYASVDFRMGSSHIENLYLAGDAVLGAGNGLANEIRGNAQDNILDGGKNNDILRGGAGNDTYLVRAPGDLVVEAAGRGGADTVKAFRAYELTPNVERLFLQTVRDAQGEGVAGINGIGNDLDNTIVGNPFANTIVGRLGNDVLKGQAGADTFVFDRAYGPGNVDRIIDFNTNTVDEGDILKLKGSVFGGLAAGQLDPDAFVAGAAAQDAGDRIVFDRASGRLWFDPDGAGGADQVLVATFEQHANVTASDILIF